MSLRAIILSDDAVRSIASGVKDVILRQTDEGLSGKDFLLVSKKKYSPGSVYVYKTIPIENQMTFDDIRANHPGMDSIGMTFPLVAHALRYRPFDDAIAVKGADQYTSMFAMVDIIAPKESALKETTDPKMYDPRKRDTLGIVEDWNSAVDMYVEGKKTGTFRFPQESIREMAFIVLRDAIRRGIAIDVPTRDWANELYLGCMKRLKPESLYADYSVHSEMVFCDVEGDFTVTNINMADFSKVDVVSVDESKLPDVLEVEGILFRPGRHKGKNFPMSAVSTATLNPKLKGWNLAYVNYAHDKYNELARSGILTDIWWDGLHPWTAKDGTKGKGVTRYKATISDKDAIRSIITRRQFQVSAEVNWEDDNWGNVSRMGYTGMAILDTPAVDVAQVDTYRGRKQGETQWSIEGKLPPAM